MKEETTNEETKWAKFLKGLPASTTGDVLYRVSLFKAADTNQDGVLTKGELREFLNKMPRTKLSKDQIETLVEAADDNNDGILQIDEFMNLFKAGYPQDSGTLSPFCD